MFPLVKNALNRLQVRSIQQTMARQSHQKRTPDFHDKYGSNTNRNRMEPVPCWQSYPKGMEKSVIIPADLKCRSMGNFKCCLSKLNRDLTTDPSEAACLPGGSRGREKLGSRPRVPCHVTCRSLSRGGPASGRGITRKWGWSREGGIKAAGRGG
ncbi:hypothetical protein H8959_000857 [Pygathrix nigripes]